MFPARIELATFRVLGGRDNHYTTETTMEEMGKVRDLLPRGTKFFGLRVLIFAVFPAIRKNKFLSIKITANIFLPSRAIRMPLLPS